MSPSPKMSERLTRAAFPSFAPGAWHWACWLCVRPCWRQLRRWPGTSALANGQPCAAAVLVPYKTAMLRTMHTAICACCPALYCLPVRASCHCCRPSWHCLEAQVAGRRFQDRLTGPSSAAHPACSCAPDPGGRVGSSLLRAWTAEFRPGVLACIPQALRRACPPEI